MGVKNGINFFFLNFFFFVSDFLVPLSLVMIPVFIGGAGRAMLHPHPRSIVVDTDTRSATPEAKICHCRDLVTGGKYFDEDPEGLIPATCTSVRRVMTTKANACVVVFHSVGGGTGAGWSVGLATALKKRFPIQIISFGLLACKVPVRPFERVNSAIWFKEGALVFDKIFLGEKIADLKSLFGLVSGNPELFDKKFVSKVHRCFGFSESCKLDQFLKRVIRSPPKGVLFCSVKKHLFLGGLGRVEVVGVDGMAGFLFVEDFCGELNFD